jgi:hypothetical protein
LIDARSSWREVDDWPDGASSSWESFRPSA